MRRTSTPDAHDGKSEQGADADQFADQPDRQQPGEHHHHDPGDDRGDIGRAETRMCTLAAMGGSSPSRAIE